MKLTKNRISKALAIGDYVYIKVNGSLGKTKVTDIEEFGVDTKYDFLCYEKHGKCWWLTKAGAITTNNKGVTQND